MAHWKAAWVDGEVGDGGGEDDEASVGACCLEGEDDTTDGDGAGSSVPSFVDRYIAWRVEGEVLRGGTGVLSFFPRLSFLPPPIFFKLMKGV